MELPDLKDSEETQSLRRRDSKFIKRRLDWILDKFFNSREVEESFLFAEKQIDPTKVHDTYTQRLLRLQDELNKKEDELGTKIAEYISENRENFGYFTAIRIIDYMLENRTGNLEHVKKVPEIIVSIRGKNGTDSKLMRYVFAKEYLPNFKNGNTHELESLAQDYVEKHDRHSNQNESAEKYHAACQDVFGGKFKLMKGWLRRSLKSDLQKYVRNLTSIEEAELLAETEE